MGGKSAVAVVLKVLSFLNGWRRARRAETDGEPCRGAMRGRGDSSTSLNDKGILKLLAARFLVWPNPAALLLFLVRLEQGPGSIASSIATNEDQGLCESGQFTGGIMTFSPCLSPPTVCPIHDITSIKLLTFMQAPPASDGWSEVQSGPLGALSEEISPLERWWWKRDARLRAAS